MDLGKQLHLHVFSSFPGLIKFETNYKIGLFVIPFLSNTLYESLNCYLFYFWRMIIRDLNDRGNKKFLYYAKQTPTKERATQRLFWTTFRTK